MRKFMAVMLVTLIITTTIVSGARMLPEETAAEKIKPLETTAPPETTAVPENTAPPETTAVPETTAPPETTAAPETEAPKPIIVSAETISVTTVMGAAPKLPGTIHVKFDNGQSGNVAVSWSAINPTSLSKKGTFEISGKVQGFPVKAKITVTYDWSGLQMRIKDDIFHKGKITVNNQPADFKWPDTSGVTKTTDKYEYVKPVFYICEVNTGKAFGLNADQEYRSASSIKAVYAYWLLAIQKVDTKEVLIFNKKTQYIGSCGIIQYSLSGSKYAVSELIKLAITISDNVAYKMLVDRFGTQRFNSWMEEEFGHNPRIAVSSSVFDLFGYLTPHALASAWVRIAEFIDSEEGEWFKNLLSSSEYKFMKMGNIPSKSGSNKYGVHDAGIYCDSSGRLFIMAIMTPATSQSKAAIAELAPKLVKLFE